MDVTPSSDPRAYLDAIINAGGPIERIDMEAEVEELGLDENPMPYRQHRPTGRWTITVTQGPVQPPAP